MLFAIYNNQNTIVSDPYSDPIWETFWTSLYLNLPVFLWRITNAISNPCLTDISTHCSTWPDSMLDQNRKVNFSWLSFINKLWQEHWRTITDIIVIYLYVLAKSAQNGNMIGSLWSLRSICIRICSFKSTHFMYIWHLSILKTGFTAVLLVKYRDAVMKEHIV